MSEDNSPQNDEGLNRSRQFWNNAAASFDDEPDHGLRDPKVLAAWTALFRAALPATQAALLDIGCGTGSLSLVLAGLGYDVTGIDLSPAMLARAESKAKLSGFTIHFQAMDAAFPQLPPQHFDVIVCRHLLWTLPEFPQVLRRWVGLLKPGGRLLLVEGYWKTGAGLHAEEIVSTLPASLTHIVVQNLSDQADLWGGQVTDERYVISADQRA
jgi:2-polyprenyl-3-methyl-5-hydroxy-6-metoxy-1,4-benzoquinol methylase